MGVVYEFKENSSSMFEVDRTQLQSFYALESDWHEIFHWIMSTDDDLYPVDNNKDHNRNVSALWHNHVLTVLLDIRHKNLKKYAVSFANGCGTTLQNEYTEDLRNKIEVNPAKRNVLDLKNETCKNREKRNVLNKSHTRHCKAIKKQSRTGCFYSF